MLERFSGYTLATLLEEDAELLRLLHIESLGGAREQQQRELEALGGLGG